MKPGTVETKSVTDEDGKTRTAYFFESAIPTPPLPIPPTDASLLHKVRHEQVLEGLVYLHRINELIRVGAWNPQFFDEYIETTSDTYRRAGDQEANPADRVPWYEARVRKLKGFELFTQTRVKDKNDPPLRLNIARFWRLQAEADLLLAPEQIEEDRPRK